MKINSKNAQNSISKLEKARKCIYLGATRFSRGDLQDAINPLKAAFASLSKVLKIKYHRRDANIFQALSYLDQPAKHLQILKALRNAITQISVVDQDQVPVDFLGWSHCLAGDLCLDMNKDKQAWGHFQVGLKYLQTSLRHKLDNDPTYAIFLQRAGDAHFGLSTRCRGACQGLKLYEEAREVIKVLKDAGDAAYLQIVLCCNIGNWLMNGNHFYAIDWLKQGYDLTKTYKYQKSDIPTKYTFKIRHQLGECYQVFESYRKATNYFKEAFEVGSLIISRQKKAEITQIIGRNLRYMKNLQESETWLVQGLAIIRNFFGTAPSKVMLMALINLTKTLVCLKKYSEAVEVIQDSMTTLKKLKLKKSTLSGILTMLLASCYNGLNKDEQAATLFNDFFKVAQHHPGDDHEIEYLILEYTRKVLILVGRVQDKRTSLEQQKELLGKLETSQAANAKKVVEIALKQYPGGIESVSLAMKQLGIFLAKLEHFVEAIICFTKALDLSDDFENKATILAYRCDCLRALGKTTLAKELIDEAEDYIGEKFCEINVSDPENGATLITRAAIAQADGDDLGARSDCEFIIDRQLEYQEELEDEDEGRDNILEFLDSIKEILEYLILPRDEIMFLKYAKEYVLDKRVDLGIKSRNQKKILTFCDGRLAELQNC
jgi:tetratricopeptide (TPR) repeat protein